ncbi:MAG: peptide chain release factor N(5)-glutamine methyltransferase [Alphaproteobacteria bacterium]|nr:peptide chain release factor N(5)-glutamine methyltransferase [Alphaproteobacteria bacterium]
MSGGPITNDGLTLDRALAEAARELGEAGIGKARHEARLLAAHVLGVTPEAVLREPQSLFHGEQAAGFRNCVTERAARRPMSQIIGNREFWSLSFRVTAETLDPRPDSETLIEAVLETVTDREAPLRILDLGTGTGCLLLALLSELPNASGVGVDVSAEALEVARGNGEALGLAERADFTVGDWGKEVEESFHVIVSNPPYIPSAEISGLEPEVARYEPRLALDGGEDGLACYRTLLVDAARLLEPSGRLFLEVGAGQAQGVEGLCAGHGLTVTGTACDLAEVPRCVMAHKALV